MDQLIKGMFNQIVGPMDTNSGSTNNNENKPKAPEEEEKKAEIFFEEPAQKKIEGALQAYEKKVVKVPECPPINAKEIASKIQVKKENDLLQIQTVLQIMHLSLDLSRKKYVDLILSNRKERRKLFHTDKKAYTAKVIELLKETENVMNQGTEELLAELGLDKENFETSLMVLMEQGFEQHLMMAQAGLVQRSKEFLGSEKEINSDQIKTILKYQLSVFSERQDEFKEIVNVLKNDPESAHFIPLGLNLIVSDINYDKFELEEEDIMTALKDPAAMMSDSELCAVLMASEDALQGLLESLGALPPMMMGPPGGFA